MAVISDLFGLIFGRNRNVLRETIEVFRENAEGSARRESETRTAALEQFSTEFQQDNRGNFDRVMDAVNRLPRPILALGTCGLFGAAMVDPVWFSERMQGLAQVPQPLWWLLGVVVSFYFGARHQVKAQDFQRHMAISAALVAQPPRQNTIPAAGARDRISAATTGGNAKQTLEVLVADENPALEDWRRDQN